MVKTTVKKFLKGVPSYMWMLLFVVAVGIFLRTWQFAHWMTFNPDQARDALLVQDMLKGKQWPLLGPQAGNTAFKLGPIFYYFEYLSAKIFGAAAPNMAYPDLLANILSIPLMFFLAQKFFRKRISLAVTGLYAISFFMVYYSRFAFNPNSIPFYVLLFLLSLANIMEYGRKENYWWAAALGASIGIGVQLHALLFVGMPIVAILVLGKMLWEKTFVWKSVLVTLVFFLFFNAGQLLSEYQTGGANVRAFFNGADSSSKSADNNFLRNVSYDLVCHVQGNTYIATSLGGGDKCDMIKLAPRMQKRGIGKNIQQLSIFILGALFFFGGLFLLGRALRQEKNANRKNALMLVAAYVLVEWLIFLPVASGISIRYFIAEAFLPFLLLGFWLEFAEQKIKQTKIASAVLVAVLLIFAACNVITIAKTAKAYQNKSAGTVNNGIYAEISGMNDYILKNLGNSKEYYLMGKREYLSRYAKPLEYFAKQHGIDSNKMDSEKKLAPGKPLFYVTKRSSKKDVLPVVSATHWTLEVKNFGNIALIKLEN